MKKYFENFLNNDFSISWHNKEKNKVLIGRRAPHERAPGLWEFPGGKMEQGETPEECLKRELMEELGIKADIGTFLQSMNTNTPMLPIRCIFTLSILFQET